jgi:hypothetical protein
MGLNVIQHESNDRLVINKQNRISNATYIGKLLDAAHSMPPNILYVIITIAQLTKNLSQENISIPTIFLWVLVQACTSLYKL